LVSLNELILDENLIRNIDKLSQLKNLIKIDLNKNRINNINSLCQLERLERVDDYWRRICSIINMIIPQYFYLLYLTSYLCAHNPTTSIFNYLYLILILFMLLNKRTNHPAHTVIKSINFVN
jgi:Leucine-rich repeat (LRR) protein